MRATFSLTIWRAHLGEHRIASNHQPVIDVGCGDRSSNRIFGLSDYRPFTQQHLDLRLGPLVMRDAFIEIVEHTNTA